MNCKTCNRLMTPLVFSMVCDHCDGLASKPIVQECFLATFTDERLKAGAHAVVWRNDAHAQAWQKRSAGSWRTRLGRAVRLKGETDALEWERLPHDHPDSPGGEFLVVRLYENPALASQGGPGRPRFVLVERL